jgi:flavin reductase (DIM6/NTAB) family NADH-FMN oxidoreductase RutF
MARKPGFGCARIEGDVMESVDFKKLMAAVPAPVTIITTAVEGKAHGATVSSFASLSLTPPLISIALIEGSHLLCAIRGSGKFAVNLLSHRQADLAVAFASRAADRFAGVSWVWTDGLPQILDAASFVVCELEQQVCAGDHTLLFGRVCAAQLSERPPLVYTSRVFGTHSKLVSDRQPTIIDVISACAS